MQYVAPKVQTLTQAFFHLENDKILIWYLIDGIAQMYKDNNEYVVRLFTLSKYKIQEYVSDSREKAEKFINYLLKQNIDIFAIDKKAYSNNNEYYNGNKN